MLYIEENDLNIIFRIIAVHYTKAEEVPDYWSEQNGIQNLLGVFERVKMSHYATLIDKVTYLFIQINKGHLFSNGNKRLALVSSIGFLTINNKTIAELSREEFRKILIFAFSDCEKDLEDHSELSASEYALYNLSIIVADSHKYISKAKGFDALKASVAKFFETTVVDE